MNTVDDTEITRRLHEDDQSVLATILSDIVPRHWQLLGLRFGEGISSDLGWNIYDGRFGCVAYRHEATPSGTMRDSTKRELSMSESDKSRNRIFQELEAVKVAIGWNEATWTTKRFWEQYER